MEENAARASKGQFYESIANSEAEPTALYDSSQRDAAVNWCTQKRE